MTEDDLTRPNLCASTYSLSVCGMVGTFQINFEKRVQSIYTNPFWIQSFYINKVNARAIGLTFIYTLCSLWCYSTHRLQSTHNMCISLSTECNVLRYVIRWHLDDWADWLLPHWASRDPIGNGREPTIVLNCTQLYSMQAKDCTRSSLHIAYCTQTVQAPGCSPCSLTTRATNWCSLTV